MYSKVKMCHFPEFLHDKEHKISIPCRYMKIALTSSILLDQGQYFFLFTTMQTGPITQLWYKLGSLNII